MKKLTTFDEFLNESIENTNPKLYKILKADKNVEIVDGYRWVFSTF
jgi:hypothetical protein